MGAEAIMSPYMRRAKLPGLLADSRPIAVVGTGGTTVVGPPPPCVAGALKVWLPLPVQVHWTVPTLTCREPPNTSRQRFEFAET